MKQGLEVLLNLWMETDMDIKIYEHLDKKGLGIKNIFDNIPVGKKGTVRHYKAPDGVFTYEFNANIRDAEVKVAIALMSYTFNQMGLSNVDRFRNNEAMLPMIDDNGQTIYTRGISVDAKQLSEMIYDGARNRGNRVFKTLRHLEHFSIRYDLTLMRGTIKLFDNVAYRNGMITFNVSNFLLNQLGAQLIAFRINPILEHNGLAMRLSMYVETHQRPGKQYTDSSGEKRRKYYPMNEYYLDDLKSVLNLIDRREDKVVSELQNAFDELHNGTNNPLPKFKYNRYRRSFENEYKNGK